MSDEARSGAEAARARGLDMPRELSVVGWDDKPEARRADPPLTTIRQSLRDQGRRCAELAASGASGALAEPQPWELVVRESTASSRRPCVNARMGSPASADIELGARVVTTQPLPEGVESGHGRDRGRRGGLDPAPLARPLRRRPVPRRARVRARSPPGHGPLPPRLERTCSSLYIVIPNGCTSPAIGSPGWRTRCSRGSPICRRRQGWSSRTCGTSSTSATRSVGCTWPRSRPAASLAGLAGRGWNARSGGGSCSGGRRR